MLQRVLRTWRFGRYLDQLEQRYERMGVLQDPLENEAVLRVRSNGYFVWPERLPEGELGPLRDEADRLLTAARAGAEAPEPAERVERVDHNLRLFGIGGRSAVIDRDFVHRPLFERIAAAYYGSPQEPTTTVAQESRPSERTDLVGFGLGGLHFDGLKRTLKIFLYLDDCGPENGPFAILPGSGGVDLPHKRAKMRACYAGGGEPATYYSAREVQELGLRDRVTEVVGPAGTLLFADTRCLHMAVPIRQGRRRVLVNYYKS